MIAIVGFMLAFAAWIGAMCALAVRGLLWAADGRWMRSAVAILLAVILIIVGAVHLYRMGEVPS